METVYSSSDCDPATTFMSFDFIADGECNIPPELPGSNHYQAACSGGKLAVSKTGCDSGCIACATDLVGTSKIGSCVSVGGGMYVTRHGECASLSGPVAAQHAWCVMTVLFTILVAVL